MYIQHLVDICVYLPVCLASWLCLGEVKYHLDIHYVNSFMYAISNYFRTIFYSTSRSVYVYRYILCATRYFSYIPGTYTDDVP